MHANGVILWKFLDIAILCPPISSNEEIRLVQAYNWNVFIYQMEASYRGFLPEGCPYIRDITNLISKCPFTYPKNG